MLASTTLKLKHEAITNDLRNNISKGIFPVGEFLPSQNELVLRYGVALGTVRQAINTLAAEGWVLPQRGKGVIVLGREKSVDPKQKREMIGFAVVGKVSPEEELGCQILIRSICSVFQSVGKTVACGVFDIDSTLQCIEGFDCFLKQLSAVIVYGNISEYVLKYIKKYDIKATIIGYPAEQTPLLDSTSIIYCDPKISGYLGGQTLGLYGHKKVGFIDACECEGTRRTLDGFNKACKEYGMENIFSVTQPRLRDELQVAGRIAKMSELTAVAVIGDMHAIRLIRNLLEFNVRVPDDKSVISFGQLPREFLGEHRSSRISSNMKEWGKRAAEMLLSQTTSVIHESITARFEKGETLKLLECASGA